MTAKHILVLGGGFAGLWSAVGAARMREELGLSEAELTITLVNRDAYHGIRVRNYEADLSRVRVPLDDVLSPIGVQRIEGRISAIDPTAQTVSVIAGEAAQSLTYDRLVFALGSELVRPQIPGLREHGFDIDTYTAGERLNAHLIALGQQQSATSADKTVVVVGAGLTGIEAACEMPDKLRAAFGPAAEQGPPARVILIDHNPQVGSDMGDSARPVIQQALDRLQIETRLGVGVTSVTGDLVTLSSGEVISTRTLVWCAGMRASPLTASFSVERDRFGRLPVDECLRVKGVPNVFAAGDSAVLRMDGTHDSVMSCQHGRPMGRFAGHNVVADLFGKPMLPLAIDWYVTVLDLGPCGAVYTEGWDRHVVATGDVAKRTKQTINCERIYPPLDGNRAEILAAAAPVVQAPPTYGQ